MVTYKFKVKHLPTNCILCRPFSSSTMWECATYINSVFTSSHPAPFHKKAVERMLLSEANNRVITYVKKKDLEQFFFKYLDRVIQQYFKIIKVKITTTEEEV